MADASNDHPLIFKLTNEIVSDRFSASVVTNGRVLMVWEDDAWWCHGVEPGGMTASGDSPPEAFTAFKIAYQDILEDLAADAKTCEEFEAIAKSFLQADEVEAERWEEARVRFRDGEQVPKPFDALRRETGTISASLEVKQTAWPASQADNSLSQAA